jgi:hypothetical protein
MRSQWIWQEQPETKTKLKSALMVNGYNSFLWGEPEEEGEAVDAADAAAALALSSFEFPSRPGSASSASLSWKGVGLSVKKHCGPGCEVEVHNLR